MPSLPDSTPTHPIAAPPRILPSAWEEHPAFRESFLLYLTEPAVNAALRTLGRLLYDLILNYYHHWPSWPEGATMTELRGALGDLRHLEGYLAAVGREHEEASLSGRDTALSLLAAQKATELARIADEMERALGGEV
jgi:hypothetical protein